MLTSLRRFPSVAEDASTYARKAKYVCQRFHHAGRNIVLCDHMFWRLQRQMGIWQYAQRHSQDMSVHSVLRCPNPPHSFLHLAFGCWLTHYNVEYYTTEWRQSLLSYPRCHAFKYLFSISVKNECPGIIFIRMETRKRQQRWFLISTLVLMLQNKEVWHSTSKRYPFIVMTNCLCYRIMNLDLFSSSSLWHGWYTPEYVLFIIQ